MNKLKLGIVGCGAIGKGIAEFCAQKLQNRLSVASIYDIDRGKSRALAGLLGKAKIASSLDDLIKKSDLVVEAAGAGVSCNVARKAILAGKDVMVMSVAGLLGRKDVFNLAQKKNVRLYVPSGAVCGIDGLKAMSMAGIKKVTLTTTKPASALKDAPYVIKNRIDLDNIKKEKIIFDGTARDAVRGFPKNINVCATISIAGIGEAKTRVRIFASSSSGKNIHELEIRGSGGRISARCENTPSPDNPKTSLLAILSAQAVLKEIASGARIGT